MKMPPSKVPTQQLLVVARVFREAATPYDQGKLPYRVDSWK